jgi:hypothetical protein
LARSKQIVHDYFRARDDITLISSELETKNRNINLTMIGDGSVSAIEQELIHRLKEAKIKNVKISIRYASSDVLEASAQSDEVR